jgi:hypothetical protein
MTAGDSLLVDDTYAVVAGEAHRRIALPDPGIDDYRNGLLWNPATPTLIDVEIELWGDRGELLDEVSSYTALRSVSVESNRLILNGRPYTLRMVLSSEGPVVLLVDDHALSVTERRYRGGPQTGCQVDDCRQPRKGKRRCGSAFGLRVSSR